MIKEQFKTYLKSFKFKRSFYYSILVDAGFWAVLLFVGFLVYTVLMRLGEKIFQEMGAEIFEDYLKTAPVDQLQVVLANTKVFFGTFVATLILFPIFVLVIYSLSRALIWHLLMKSKFRKKYIWRWMAENLILLLIFVGVLFTYVVLNIVIGFLTGKLDLLYFYIIDRIVLAFLLMAFIYFMLLAYIHLTKVGKVLKSLGDTFRFIKKKFKSVAFSFIFIILTLIILSLISFLIGLTGIIINQYIPIVISLVVLAWMRVYILKVVEE